jgi:hypothetical protein
MTGGCLTFSIHDYRRKSMKMFSNTAKILSLGAVLWLSLAVQSAVAQIIPGPGGSSTFPWPGTWSGGYYSGGGAQIVDGTLTITIDSNGGVTCDFHNTTTSQDYVLTGTASTGDVLIPFGATFVFGCDSPTGTSSADTWTVTGQNYIIYNGLLMGNWQTGSGSTGSFTATPSSSTVLATIPQSVTGNWYDPVYNGSGFDIFMAGQGLVVIYYGWDGSGNRLWLISNAGPTQITSGTAYTLNMNQTSGGNFLTPASPSTSAVWGTVRISFSSCSAATASLSSQDGKNNVTLNLQKLIGIGALVPGC